MKSFFDSGLKILGAVAAVVIVFYLFVLMQSWF